MLDTVNMLLNEVERGINVSTIYGIEKIKEGIPNIINLGILSFHFPLRFNSVKKLSTPRTIPIPPKNTSFINVTNQ